MGATVPNEPKNKKKIALVLDYVILFFVHIMNTHLIPTNSWDILRQILSFYLPLTFF